MAFVGGLGLGHGPGLGAGCACAVPVPPCSRVLFPHISPGARGNAYKHENALKKTFLFTCYSPCLVLLLTSREPPWTVDRGSDRGRRPSPTTHTVYFVHGDSNARHSHMTRDTTSSIFKSGRSILLPASPPSPLTHAFTYALYHRQQHAMLPYGASQKPWRGCG